MMRDMGWAVVEIEARVKPGRGVGAGGCLPAWRIGGDSRLLAAHAARSGAWVECFPGG